MQWKHNEVLGDTLQIYSIPSFVSLVVVRDTTPAVMTLLHHPSSTRDTFPDSAEYMYASVKYNVYVGSIKLHDNNKKSTHHSRKKNSKDFKMSLFPSHRGLSG